MFASALLLFALAAQPTSEDDGPVQTAPKELVSSAVPGLDEKAIEPPPAGSRPVDEKKTAPAAVAATKALTVEQKTLVQGGTLQVVLGQRALFRLDDKGQPVLAKVEEGKLAAAHPAGEVTETFEPPPWSCVRARSRPRRPPSAPCRRTRCAPRPGNVPSSPSA